MADSVSVKRGKDGFIIRWSEMIDESTRVSKKEVIEYGKDMERSLEAAISFAQECLAKPTKVK